MKLRTMIIAGISGAAASGSIIAFAAAPSRDSVDTENLRHAQRQIEEGRKIFRYETFGSEAFWGDALQLHKAIAGEKNGGVGPGVSPKTALSVGLKVDADALPASLKKQLAAGKVNLDDPATTIALLKLNQRETIFLGEFPHSFVIDFARRSRNSCGGIRIDRHA